MLSVLGGGTFLKHQTLLMNIERLRIDSDDLLLDYLGHMADVKPVNAAYCSLCCIHLSSYDFDKSKLVAMSIHSVNPNQSNPLASPTCLKHA